MQMFQLKLGPFLNWSKGPIGFCNEYAPCRLLCPTFDANGLLANLNRSSVSATHEITPFLSTYIYRTHL